MSLFHAVVWIDHQKAQILQFDAEHVQSQKVKAHTHHRAYHGSAVRTGHEFFGEVCDALKGPASRGAGDRLAQQHGRLQALRRQAPRRAGPSRSSAARRSIT